MAAKVSCTALPGSSTSRDSARTVAPAFAEVDASLIGRAVDGVVLPVAEHRDELVLTGRRIPVADFSWEPIAPEAPAEPVAEPAAEADENEGDDAVAVEDAPIEVLPAAAAITWSGSDAARTAPGRDNYALRLAAGRRLYDAGRTVSASPSLAGLAAEAALRVHPQELSRIGVAEGERVRVSTARGSQILALHADDAVPMGVAVMPFNLAGPGVGDLVDATAVVTDLRVETVR